MTLSRVADSMKLRNNPARIKSSVTLYNLPDKKQNRRDVMAMLSADFASCVLNADICLGRSLHLLNDLALT
jgi:hypothetical protein